MSNMLVPKVAWPTFSPYTVLVDKHALPATISTTTLLIG